MRGQHDCKVIGYCGEVPCNDEDKTLEVRVLAKGSTWFLWSWDEQNKGLTAGRFIEITFCPFCGEKL